MIQHFIISPFSYRRQGFNKNRFPDPLGIKVLKHRLKIFEMVTVASIKAQVFKNFSWIIVVDPKLPEQFRNKIRELTKDIQNTIIHDFSPEIDDISLGWMKRYISPETNYVATSILGCDDGLFRGFTKYINENIHVSQIEEGFIPVMFYACKNIVQWDFFQSKKAPLGYQKPWTRKNTLIVSPGLTLCCKYPELDFSITGIPHSLLDYLFIDKPKRKELNPAFSGHLKKKQQEIKTRAHQSSLDWDGTLSYKKNFHAISTNFPQTVVVNHFGNVRYRRLFEAPDLRTPVQANISFPEVAIDYPLAAKYIQSFRRSIPLFLEIAKNTIRYNPSEKPGMSLKNRLKEKVKRLRFMIKGFNHLE